jgi:branched-subunit amino acid transport protein
MTTSYPDPVVWVAILAMAALTYAIRGSFIALFGRLDEIPPRIEIPLRYVPAAVLAGLVFPAFVALDGAGGPAMDKLLAGGIAAAVAWRTENVLATLLAGMGTLWLLRFLVL